MNTKGLVLALVLLASLVIAACGTAPSAPAPIRVLFVGNSLVYTANLPAVLDALGEANGRAIHGEMLVRGGATLQQRVEDGALDVVLGKASYDYVVLQERGGGLICGDAASCETARVSAEALQALAATARAHGARPLSLGTYQPMPRASDALLVGEAGAAAAASVPLVPVSALYGQAVATHPQLQWHDPDGMHPGPQLQLLQAVLLYRQITGEYPDATGFTVSAPMYPPRARFFPPLLASEKAQLPAGAPDDMADGHVYPDEAVSVALELARGG